MPGHDAGEKEGLVNRAVPWASARLLASGKRAISEGHSPEIARLKEDVERGTSGKILAFTMIAQRSAQRPQKLRRRLTLQRL